MIQEIWAYVLGEPDLEKTKTIVKELRQADIRTLHTPINGMSPKVKLAIKDDSGMTYSREYYSPAFGSIKNLYSSLENLKLSRLYDIDCPVWDIFPNA